MTLAIYSPYNEALVDEVPFTPPESIEHAITLAYETFKNRSEWLPVAARLEILEKTHHLLQREKTALIRTAVLEGGKPWADSSIEMDRALQGIQTAIATLRSCKGEQIPMELTSGTQNRLAYTYREPVGVVFAISAFNHPLNLIIHQVIPAIATGCPVLIKPAQKTPISCFNIVNTLYEAGLPRAFCQVLICNHSIAEKIASDPRISFLSFIGSANVGWHLRSKLAPGTHCVLEHGGAAPVIVEPDANLEKTIPLLVKGGFYHAGQVCVSVQRVFVHKTIIEIFCEQMVKHTQTLQVGDPLDPHTEVGPLINPGEVNRVEEWVLEAISKGTHVLCGAKKLSLTCYAPTLLLNPPSHCLVSQKEIFGPVVCIYSYEDRETAIQLANEVPFSFQSAVFTQDINVAYEIVQKLEATTVMINDHSAFRADWMPFGGRKHSGLGVGGIPYTMRDMTFEKLWVLKV
jgi:acyl-CoA reductase-like NAD-dependent aldehyde dehydrogenase